jgi:molybdopterin-containing oxidoreductase family iron-sulfur binding subunit
MHLVGRGKDSFAYSGISVAEEGIKITGKKHSIPQTQTTYRYGFNTENRAFFAPGTLPNAPLGGSSQYNRALIQETTIAEYKKGPKNKEQYKPAKIEGPSIEEARVMKPWPYDGMRWHMTVDLNACIGCGACAISCHIENNVPVVGPEEVYVGREMHWMRIDRYFSGSEENPQVAYQPLMCQHCENAPCENVCPVAATQHNSEGLNVMAYNRCIGTRYCANNCPYKVRRFNWFENWYYMEGLQHGNLRSPIHLGLNPDVAVRSRGVIEKCSFCIHRINQARTNMRAEDKTSIADGVVQSACEEVCPTQAIHFGNVNDKNSKVYQVAKEDPRAYRILEFLAVEPSVTYLAKVRNEKA